MIQPPLAQRLETDPQETREWRDALLSVVKHAGLTRGLFLIEQLLTVLRAAGATGAIGMTTPPVNTIPLDQEAQLPAADIEIAKRANAWIRWNAKAMVVQGGKQSSELGGHIATYASSAVLYDTGLNYFFRARSDAHPGDLIFWQGHASPGMYARAFLEGRLSEKQLYNFRQEVDGQGLSSYPHPWLMPDFWQFPTVSMGLGPLQAIYQARFLKYLGNRGLIDNKDRHVWAFLGDGEMDEPESLGAIGLAGRERLDNLIFVINCNLQRLDGPVRGNGQIVAELESQFRGANWRVIKLLWDKGWDQVFARDRYGLVAAHLSQVVDGDMQNYAVRGGAFFREHFWQRDPALAALVSDFSDDELAELGRGGHDAQKVYAAYHAATQQREHPVVILVQTLKGFGMGEIGEGVNTTHQQKKMPAESLEQFAERFDLPLDGEIVREGKVYHPGAECEEVQFLLAKRAKLGGPLPARQSATDTVAVPSLSLFQAQLEGSGEREISTTMAFVRILGSLLKDKSFGPRVVPIVPDESRTFGMEGLFRQIGIYAPDGQRYEPVDKKQVMYYREAKDGQLLQEGINEAGAFSSWLAAATSYSTNGLTMVPFYIYYSMFGFQRVGDLAWAAGDMRARGFLLGGTAGRTTLAGEGLQHQDGNSHTIANLIPNCVTYDPTFAYELAVIIQDGLRRMVGEQEDVFYYLAVMNENYQQPAMPAGAEEGIVRGMYSFQSTDNPSEKHVQLLGSGAILREVIKAAELLSTEFGVSADIWSVTSFNELGREADKVERYNQRHPDQTARVPYVTKCLTGQTGPVIAATDYVRAYAEQIRAFVPSSYAVLGTDGFGRSGTRAQLRRFFEVDAAHIAYQALYALGGSGKIPMADVLAAQQQLGIDPDLADPTAR